MFQKSYFRRLQKQEAFAFAIRLEQYPQISVVHLKELLQHNERMVKRTTRVSRQLFRNSEYLPRVLFGQLDVCSLSQVNEFSQRERERFVAIVPLGSSGGSNWTIQSTAGIWVNVSVKYVIILVLTHIKPSRSYVSCDQRPFRSVTNQTLVK